MKNIIILAVGTMISISALAQSNKEDVDLIQAIYGKEKKAIVADFIMPPDAAKKTAFWKLYDKYETERKALGKKRVALLEKYANAYTSLDDKSTDAITLREVSSFTIAITKVLPAVLCDNVTFGSCHVFTISVDGPQAGIPEITSVISINCTIFFTSITCFISAYFKLIIISS